MPTDDRISKLYAGLKKYGVSDRDLGGSVEDFRSAMKDSTMRSDFYEWAARKGFDLGTKDEYMGKLAEAYGETKAEESLTMRPFSMPQNPFAVYPPQREESMPYAERAPKVEAPKAEAKPEGKTSGTVAKAQQTMVMKPAEKEVPMMSPADAIHGIGRQDETYSYPLMAKKEILEEIDTERRGSATKTMPTLQEFVENKQMNEGPGQLLRNLSPQNPNSARLRFQDKQIADAHNKLFGETKQEVNDVVEKAWESTQAKAEKTQRGDIPGMTEAGKTLLSTTGNLALGAVTSRDYERSFNQVFSQLKDTFEKTNFAEQVSKMAKLTGYTDKDYLDYVAIPRLYEQLKEKLIEKNMPTDKWDKALREGLRNTIFGLIVNAPKVWADPTQAEIEQVALDKVKGSFGSDLVGTTASIIGDMWAFGVGGMASDMVAKGAVKATTRQFIKKGIEREASERLAQEAMKRGGLRLATAVASSSANLATFNAVHSIAEQVNQGKVDLGSMAESVASGAVLGGVLGVTGSYAHELTKYLNNTLGRAAEGTFLGETGGRIVGQMLGAGAGLEVNNHVMAGLNAFELAMKGEEVDYKKLYDDALKMNLGFGIIHALKSARNLSDPKTFMRVLGTDGTLFTGTEIEDLKRAGLEGDTYSSMISKLGELVTESKVEGPESASRELTAFLTNPELTSETRDKISWLLTGEHLEAPATVFTSVHKEGNQYVVSGYAGPDVVNFRRYFNTEKEARAYRDQVDDAVANPNGLRQNMRNAVVGFKTAILETAHNGLADAIKTDGENVEELEMDIVSAYYKSVTGTELTPKEKSVMKRISDMAEADENFANMLEEKLGSKNVYALVDQVCELYGVDKKALVESAYNSNNLAELRAKDPNMYQAVMEFKNSLMDMMGQTERYADAIASRESDTGTEDTGESFGMGDFFGRIKSAMRERYEGVKASFEEYKNRLRIGKGAVEEDAAMYDGEQNAESAEALREQLVAEGAEAYAQQVEQRISEYEGTEMPADIRDLIDNMEGTKVGDALRAYAEELMRGKEGAEAQENTNLVEFESLLNDKNAIAEDGTVREILWKDSPTDVGASHAGIVTGETETTYIVLGSDGKPQIVSKALVDGVETTTPEETLTYLYMYAPTEVFGEGYMGEVEGYAPEGTPGEGEGAEGAGAPAPVAVEPEPRPIEPQGGGGAEMPMGGTAMDGGAQDGQGVGTSGEMPRTATEGEGKPASVTPSGVQLDAQGEPIVDAQTDPAKVADFYMNHPANLSNGVVDGLVQAKLNDAKTALEKANAEEEPMPTSAGIADYTQRHGEWQKAKDEASQAVDFWTNVQREIQAARTRGAGPAVGEGEVPDITFDTPKAARERGYVMVNGQRVDRAPVHTDGMIWGKDTEVIFHNGEDGKVKARYALAPQEWAQPSHINGAENPARFATKDGQPKDRDSRASEEGIKGIAKNPDRRILDGNSAYEGAPVVNTRWEDIQGNGRDDALNRMQGTQSADVYKQMLLDNPEAFGFTREQVENMPEGYTLKRVVDVDDNRFIELGQYTSADMESAGERGLDPVNTVNRLNQSGKAGQFVKMLLNDPEGEMSISGMIKANGYDVLRQALQDGIITQTQFESATEGTKLTDAARGELERMLDGLVLGDATGTMRVAYENLPERVQEAVIDAYAKDLNVSNDRKIMPEIRKALDLLGYTRAKNGTDLANARGEEEVMRAINDAVSYAGDLVDSAVPQYSDFEKALAAKIGGLKGRELKDLFNQYYEQTKPVEGDLFEDKQALTKAEAIEQIFGVRRNEEPIRAGVTSVADAGNTGGTRRNVLPSGTGRSEQVAEGTRTANGGRDAVGKPTDIQDLNKTGILDNIKTVDDLHELFNTLNGDAVLKAMADKVFDTIKKVGLKEVLLKDTLAGAVAQHTMSHTSIDPGTQIHRITISRAGMRSDVTNQEKGTYLLHEGIHRLTNVAVRLSNGTLSAEMSDAMPEPLRNALKNAGDKLNKIYGLIKDDDTFKGMYGVWEKYLNPATHEIEVRQHKDAREMVAELSNPEFRDKLKEKELWVQTIDAISEIFDYEVEGAEKSDALNETHKALEQCMDALNGKLEGEERPIKGMLTEADIDAIDGLSARDKQLAKTYVQKLTENHEFKSDYLEPFYEKAVEAIQKARGNNAAIPANDSGAQGQPGRNAGEVRPSTLEELNDLIKSAPKKATLDVLTQWFEEQKARAIKTHGENDATVRWTDSYLRNPGYIRSIARPEEPKKMGSVEEELSKADAKINDLLAQLEALEGDSQDDRNSKKVLTNDEDIAREVLDERNRMVEADDKVKKLRMQLADALAEAGYQMVRAGKTNEKDWMEAMTERYGKILQNHFKWENEKGLTQYLNDVRDYTPVPNENGEVKTIKEHFVQENGEKLDDATIDKTDDMAVAEQIATSEQESGAEVLESTKKFVLLPEHKKFIDSIVSQIGTTIEKPDAFASILKLRELARACGIEVSKTGKDDVLLNELVERALVTKAREVINNGRDWDDNSRDIFDKILKLYETQPSLLARNGDSIAKQQYSTPLPMSFVADMFAYREGETKSVLEPTAGNGMLVIGVPEGIVTANEISGIRVANLQDQPFKEVTTNDATKPFAGEYDAIISNPPFGSGVEVKIGEYTINGLDPVIAVNALQNMKPNGRAAIILGGHVQYGKNGGVTGSKRDFLCYLYDNYNVKGVVDMGGNLYAKQGTTYPTMMILIDGKRTEEDKARGTVYPPVKDNAIAEVTSFEELYNTVEGLINSNDKTNGTEIIHDGRGELGTQPLRPRRGVDNTGRGQEYPTTQGERGNADERQPRGGVLGRNEPGLGRTDNATSETTPARTDGGRTGEQAVGNGGVQLDNATDGAREGVGTQQVGSHERREPEKRELGQSKVSYASHASGYDLQAVTPGDMAEATDRALTKLTEKVGNIDEYLKKELGYTDEELGGLAALQRDAVALAIDQMKQGKGLIIGDQTGMGKGRQMAALIRWANRQGKKPIFVTQKSGLFSDIYRDLIDVHGDHLKPFIFNDDKEAAMTIVGEDGKLKVVHKALPKAKQAKIFATGKVPDEYDYVVLTYSQINSGDEKSAEEFGRKAPAKVSPKTSFLRQIAKGNFMFMDESHTASGDSNTGAFFQSIIKDASAVTFASATFAKRPDSMPLYAYNTALSDANIESKDLIEAIGKVGVPLQEVMSRGLSEAGQMVRRERNMDGVVTDWKTISTPEIVQKSRQQYDTTIEAFNALVDFQRNFIETTLNNKGQEFAVTATGISSKRGTKDFGINNTPIMSQTYNLTKQMMLALKVDAVVEEVLAEIKKGRHPVIALENTMGSAISDYADGEVVEEPTFRGTLTRMLNKCLQYEIKAGDDVTYGTLDPSELGAEGEAEYYRLIDEVIPAATEGLFISPLDQIIEKLGNAGLKVGELTGRDRMLVNKNGKYVVARRTDRNKKAVAADFNAGAVDVVIVNKTGSTGISLHASEKFKDQRPRTMIIAQPLSDINDYMQMIGRIDRTGQIHRGYYINLGLPVPAENRFLMMLSTKLKSLNANTTSSQENKGSDVEAPDLLNKYGSQVVVEYLKDNPEIYDKLADPFKLGKDGSLQDYTSKGTDEDIKTVTGRVALLSIEEQEAFYNDVVERYENLIKILDETGENDLKITALPLKAKTLDKRVSSPGKFPDGDNPFARDAYLERVEMDVLKKPMKAEEVQKNMTAINEGMPENEHTQKLIDQENDRYNEKVKKENTRWAAWQEKAWATQDAYMKDPNKTDEAKKAFKDKFDLDYDNAREKHDLNLMKLRQAHNAFVQQMQYFKVGQTYIVPMSLDDKMGLATSRGIFLGYKFNGKDIVPSKIEATFATLDGRRQVRVLLSRPEHVYNIYNLSYQNFDALRMTNLRNWDEQRPDETRKEGYILTGNILQAVVDTMDPETGIFTGQLVSYTDIDGNIKDGILMPDGWNPGLLRSAGIPINARISEIMEQDRGDALVSTDGNVTIKNESWSGTTRTLIIPSAKKNNKKFFDSKEFVSKIGRMEDFYGYSGKRLAIDVPLGNVSDVLNVLANLGVRVTDDKPVEHQEEVNKMQRLGDAWADAEEVMDEVNNAKHLVPDIDDYDALVEYGFETDPYLDDNELGTIWSAVDSYRPKIKKGEKIIVHSANNCYFCTSKGYGKGLDVHAGIEIAGNEDILNILTDGKEDRIIRNPNSLANFVRRLGDAERDRVLGAYHGEEGVDRAKDGTLSARGASNGARVSELDGAVHAESQAKGKEKVAKNNLGDYYADAEDILSNLRAAEAEAEYEGDIETTPEDLEEADEVLDDVNHKIREDEPPTKTGVGYKVFVLKEGKLYPPMVANPGGADTPVGVWLDADAAPVVSQTKTGRNQVKAGGKGTQGGSGKLAYRPGWHLGTIPYALQFNRKNPETGERELFPNNFVWAKVKYANDVDYQKEAESYGYNEKGNYQHSLAGLPRLPENGSYMYRTNPDPRTDPWVITGSMKVDKLLTPTEVERMVMDAGRDPQPRQSGGFDDEEIEKLNEALGLNGTDPDDTPRGGGKPKRKNNIGDVWADAQEVLDEVNRKTEDTGMTLSTDPDVRIMRSDIGRVREDYDKKLMGEWHQQAEVWHDYAKSVETAQNLIEERIGRRLTPAENAYDYENHMHSINQVQIDRFNDAVYDPLLKEAVDVCKKGKLSLDDLEDYIIAKSGIERNIVLKDRDEKAGLTVKNKDYSGLTSLMGEKDLAKATALAQDLVDEIEAKVDTKDLWSRINLATGTSLHKAYESGQISEETYKNIKGMMQYYVPLRGWREEMAEDYYSYEREMRKGVSGVVKGAKGRRSVADNPLAVIGAMGEAAVTQGNRNVLYQKLLNLAQNARTDLLSVNKLYIQRNPLTDEWEAVFPDLKGKEGKEAEDIMKQFYEDMAARVASDPANFAEGHDKRGIKYKIGRDQVPEHQIIAYRDGKPYVITVNGNPRLAKALRGDMRHSRKNNELYRAISSTTRYLSLIYTSFSPQFIINNPMRDFTTAGSNAFASDGGSYAAGFMRNWATNLGRIRGLYKKYEKGKLDMSNKAHKYFKEYMENGGQTGFAVELGVEGRREQLEDTYFKNTGKKQGRPMTRMERENMTRAIGWYAKRGMDKTAEMIHKLYLDKSVSPAKFLLSVLQDANKYMENLTRFSTYMESRQKGKSIMDAITDAKNITGNYNRHGAGMTMADEKTAGVATKASAFTAQAFFSIHSFINAGIQSFDTVFNQNLKSKKRAARLTGLIASWALAGYLWRLAHEAMADEEDGDAPYFDIPEYERRNKACLPISNGEYLGAPLAFQYRSMWALGDIMAEMQYGNTDKSNSDYAKEITHAFASMMPFYILEGDQPNDNSNMPKAIARKVLLPDIIKAPFHIYTNTKWNGGKVHADSPWAEGQPEYRKAFKTTDPDMAKFSEWLWESTNTPGMGQRDGININPNDLEYVLENYLGGIYKEAMKDKRFAQGLLNGEPMKKRNIPLFGTLFREVDMSRGGRRDVNLWYKNKEHAKYVKQDFDSYTAEQQDSARQTPEMQWYLKWHEYEKQMNNVNKALNATNNEERKEKLQKRAVELMKRMNDMTRKELGQE